jgi:hypothetical protein
MLDAQHVRLEAEFDARLREERARWAAKSPREQDVQLRLRHVTETIFTLKCPRCSRAFVDFSGCFALSCHGCPCKFCAICLADCGNDAHAHVRECGRAVLQGGYHGGVGVFEQVQCERRQRLLSAYLAGIRDAATFNDLVFPLDD